MIGLYIHIPYCVQKCAYCDFVSFTHCNDKAQYALAVCNEIKNKSQLFGKLQVDTIYFGGGTPTLMNADYIEKIMSSIHNQFNIAGNAEITMEANPATYTKEYLKRVKTLGVNRLSIGVQSLNDNELRSIGRIHNANEAIMAVELASKSGFENISVDIMMGLPQQTADSMDATMKNILHLPITHLSAYELKIEKGTQLESCIKNKIIVLPNESELNKIDQIKTQQLMRNGFKHYEISNYAKNGNVSKHNLKYWRNEEYLGVGCSAHSRMGNKRFSNTANLNQYIENNGSNESITFQEQITPKDYLFETIMLGLRLTKGINVTAIEKKHKVNFIEKYQQEINYLQTNNMLKIVGDNLWLTEEGLKYQNSVLMHFME